MRKVMSFGVATAIVVSSMAGIPGFANTPLGVSEAHADGRYGRRHHRRGDGFDLGDAIVGAVVAGGLIAVLSGASKKKKEEEQDRPLDSGWEPEATGTVMAPMGAATATITAIGAGRTATGRTAPTKSVPPSPPVRAKPKTSAAATAARRV